jgi:hypothetical protein
MTLYARRVTSRAVNVDLIRAYSIPAMPIQERDAT